MDCMCPACRGLNDEKHDGSEIETKEVEVEVTFKERVKLAVPVYEDSQAEIDHIHKIVEDIYVDVEVEDWELI